MSALSTVVKRELDMSLKSGTNLLEAYDWLVLKDVLTNYMCHTCPLECGVNNGRQLTYLKYIFFIMLDSYCACRG